LNAAMIAVLKMARDRVKAKIKAAKASSDKVAALKKTAENKENSELE